MVRRRAMALGGLLLLAAAVGCYATTPHRAGVVAPAPLRSCVTAAEAVLTQAGFDSLPPPPGITSFFAPRVAGAIRAQMAANSGVTIVATGNDVECRVFFEAVSTDGMCPDEDYFECEHPVLQRTPLPPRDGPYPRRGCRDSLMTCPLTSAPGPSNDAAVDELARRLRAALAEMRPSAHQ